MNGSNTAADTFVYTGEGGMNVEGYDNSDKVSLPEGYTVDVDNATVDTENGTVTVTVKDSDNKESTITISGIEKDVTAVKVGDSTIALDDTEEFWSFNNSNPAAATKVTLLGNYGDFGVQGDENDSGYKKGGKEYYNMLYTVQASQANSTIIANHNPNTIYTVGGNRNVLTGGLGKDTFVFGRTADGQQTGGGGVITDFGVGATKSHYSGGVTFATSATVSAYDRNDPTTYAMGVDVLQVYGKVKSVAFEGHNDNSTANNPILTVVYVTYTADADEKDYTIALCNIYKKPVKGNLWQTDDVAAKTLKIWDTSGGQLANISTTNLETKFTSSLAHVPEELIQLAAKFNGTNGIK